MNQLAEISNHGGAACLVGEEDVGWFDIEVHAVVCVDVREALQDVVDVATQFVLRERSILQGSSFSQFHEDGARGVRVVAEINIHCFNSGNCVWRLCGVALEDGQISNQVVVRRH